MSRYVFGFDFGTLSCRGVAIDLSDGRLAATAESSYRSGVISGRMKHKEIALEPEWNLQDPDDWLESMACVSRQMLDSAGIRPEEVLGVGTDFTSCTLLPVLEDGTPLCTLDIYRDRPNAWPKLWKHHGAQRYAEKIEACAKAHTDWLDTYFGGAVSSEWAYPKILQVAEEDPDIYRAADYFMEAVDYIVFRLTGQNTRTNGILGVNAFYIEGRGYPDREFARALNPLMEVRSQRRSGCRRGSRRDEERQHAAGDGNQYLSSDDVQGIPSGDGNLLDRGRRYDPGTVWIRIRTAGNRRRVQLVC